MRNLLFGVIVLLSVSCVAQADVVYDSQAAWAASVSGITTINFEGIAPVDGYLNVTPATVVGGVTFGVGPASLPGASLWVMGDNFYYPGYAVVSSQAAEGTLDLLVTLPSAATAVGFNYIVGPGTMTVSLPDGTSVVLNPSGAGNNFGFFGVTAPGGITSVDITEPYTLSSEAINMADFSYGSATVPEPSALLLLGTMMAGVGILCRRRRTN